jgi:hypothetical protein
MSYPVNHDVEACLVESNYAMLPPWDSLWVPRDTSLSFRSCIVDAILLHPFTIMVLSPDHKDVGEEVDEEKKRQIGSEKSKSIKPRAPKMTDI